MRPADEVLAGSDIGDARADSEMQADFDVLRGYLAPPGPWVQTDAILCFGCYGSSVPTRAGRLYERGLAPWIVVSGRGRAHRDEPEADAFARVLVGEGVPWQRIVLERKAANIGENVVLGLAAARDHGIDVRSVTVVAHVDGIRRCLATLSRRAPEVAAWPSPLVFRGPPSPSAIDNALAELHRLRTYPSLGYITVQAEPPEVTRAAARLARVVGCTPRSAVDEVPTGVIALGSGLEPEDAPLLGGQ